MFVTLSKNKPYFILLLLLATLCSYNNSYAAPPPAGAPKKNDCNKALTAITIQNINFGEFDANTGGTITIATDGTRTASGGVILLGGTAAATIFEVNNTLAGCEVYPVGIRAVKNTTLTEPTGSTMVATNFITFPASGFTLIPGTPQLIEVGADLTATAGQIGGTYDTLTFYSFSFRY